MFWHKAFSEGNVNRQATSLDDDNIEKVQKTVLINNTISIREIVEDINISYGSTQHSLVNVLGMKYVNTKYVPKYLNYLRKRRRLEIANEIAEDLIYIKHIINW